MNYYTASKKAFDSMVKQADAANGLSNVIREQLTNVTEKVKSYIGTRRGAGADFSSYIGITRGGLTKMLAKPFNCPAYSLPLIAYGLFDTTIHDFLWDQPGEIILPTLYNAFFTLCEKKERKAVIEILSKAGEKAKGYPQFLSEKKENNVFPGISICSLRERILECGNDRFLKECDAISEFGSLIEERFYFVMNDETSKRGVWTDAFMVLSSLFGKPVDYFVVQDYAKVSGMRIYMTLDSGKKKALPISYRKFLSALLSMQNREEILEILAETTAAVMGAPAAEG